MVKLLIIADDFTGALDTGIQFVNKGIATQVFTKMPEAIGDIDETTEVLVIDSETRPMPAAKAYDAVKNIIGWAKAIKIPIIFKKILANWFVTVFGRMTTATGTIVIKKGNF